MDRSSIFFIDEDEIVSRVRARDGRSTRPVNRNREIVNRIYYSVSTRARETSRFDAVMKSYFGTEHYL